MFDHIKIEGFRSFKRVELDLLPLPVLIGPNGGGKSNLLDLLMLITEAGNGHLAIGLNKRWMRMSGDLPRQGREQISRRGCGLAGASAIGLLSRY